MKNRVISMIILNILVAVYILFAFSGYTPVLAVIDKTSPLWPVSSMSETFPDSYMPYINALKAAHPNWIFKAVKTNLDWNFSISQESYDVNLAISLVDTRDTPRIDSYWKKDGTDYFKDGPFVIASKEAIAYAMDPRNFLTDSGIFQFQSLGYSDNIDTIDAVNNVLSGTYMGDAVYKTQYQNAGKWVVLTDLNGNNTSYAQLILDLSKSRNVSAVYIASLIRQETSGNIINNGSINGSTPGYTGYYNFFNIGATPSDTADAITNGLITAQAQGWTTPAKSIDAGIYSITKNYIQWGQDTPYFQKFDVNNPGQAGHLYSNQYMTNILAPSSQSNTTYNAYKTAGKLEDKYEFHIPVYTAMPDISASYPYGYTSEATKVSVYDVSTTLAVRASPSVSAYTIATLAPTATATRIQKGTSLPWDRVILPDGRIGYVSNAYVTPVPTVSVTGVSVSPTSVTFKAGETQKLTPAISPTNASIKNVSWSSSDNNIASVDSSRHCNC